MLRAHLNERQRRLLLEGRGHGVGARRDQGGSAGDGGSSGYSTVADYGAPIRMRYVHLDHVWASERAVAGSAAFWLISMKGVSISVP